ncbi:A-kinase anchor protein 9 isoform X2 [Pseudophryne corroboree]|uniref:A-kinase anchor protein 9 isoform X2 n=1 Tax=Pseudophryne corroboree TaxID=495146 RepID=UPI0030813911
MVTWRRWGRAAAAANNTAHCVCAGAGVMEPEDPERRRKLEAGKAKLAQFRQRKGQPDSQSSAKKTKKKKSSSSSKQQDHPDEASEAALSQSDDTRSQAAPSGASTTAEFTIMRTMPHGETIKHDKTYTIEPESEVSTTADDYSSEAVADHFLLSSDSASHTHWEEEFGVQETFSERGNQSSLSRLEVMEDELAGKRQEIEELNRELEEMRAAYGTEGLQQLQEFEMAIKQRDSIITQLTTNLQQARKEKDDIMREFLDLTEQSQKLKIQFQHLQAGETLRNTSHTSTAADLLHSKQQLFTYQQQLEERGHQLRQCQKENEDFQTQVISLREQMHILHQVQQKELELSHKQKMNEKDLELDSLKSALHNEEIKCLELKERISASEKSADELREQLTQKIQEINSLCDELNISKQKERRSSDEIKQLMGTVEDLQKKHYKGSQSEADLVQRMELETQKKLEQLQAELDEIHGQQIVQMKQELAKQHALDIERLLVQHRQEVDNVNSQTTIRVTNDQINELNAVISELNARLLQSDEQRIKMKEDFSQRLETVSSEKSHLQRQIEDLLQDLSYAREQVHRVKQSLTEKENKLNEASSLFVTIDNLKAELAAANESTKELESKHEAEVTNYKIKLEMLEREKDAVLDRMAESQEAEFEKLRTHFLFSQEEELTKLREDLTLEHKTNLENLKDNLEVQYKQQIDQMQDESSRTITAMQSENDSLITKQTSLMQEISTMKDLMQSVRDPKSEELMIQVNELQKQLDYLRNEEKEKGTIEQEVQALQLRIEFLENEVKDKDALNLKLTVLEDDSRLLKDKNETLENILKECNTEICENLPELVHSGHFDVKNNIEFLISENKRLQNLELQLKEEIQRQKNTFSFAEKNFEVNYHELQEEYTCLVKVKEQLEDSKSKLEKESRMQLVAVNDELAKLKGVSAGEDQLGPSESINADKLGGGEIVEKDTTELMEKLENVQRDKQELSAKLSNLIEQLQVKQNEINRLKEQVNALCFERDHVLSENIQKSKQGNGSESTAKGEHLVDYKVISDDSPLLPLSPQVYNVSKQPELSVVERDTHLERLQELTSKPDSGSSLPGCDQPEKDALTQTLDILQDQEAQRVSLTQTPKAHLEQISESFHADTESERCSLRDSLLTAQDQRTQVLQDVPHPELVQHTAVEGETCQVLTETLMKIINKECDHINQILFGRLTDKEDKAEGTQMLEDVAHFTCLEQHRTAVQTLHTNLTVLLERFLKEYKQMRDISSCVEKTGDLHSRREDPDITGVRQIVIESQTSALSRSVNLLSLDVQESASEEVERLKIEFSQQRAQLEDKHSEEIEHLRAYFQQQLQENEDRFSTEIIHLQEQFQDVTEGSVQFRELCENEAGVGLGLQEAAIFQSVCASVPDMQKTDEVAQMGEHSVRMPGGPIYHQLQTLRQALFSKYVEEVHALKKQHEAELSQLRADLTEKHDRENAAMKQEIARLTSAKQEILNGSLQAPTLVTRTEEKNPVDLNQLLEERYHEKIEEEIARVIVEMTIAFAQQTELTRLSSQKTVDSKVRDIEVTDQDGQKLGDEQRPESQPLEGKLQGGIQLKEMPESDEQDVDLIIAQSSITASNEKEMTPEGRNTDLGIEALSKDKTLVLKEKDYNQLVAMGAESAKFKQMYEERVEEMSQELVRQEQEYQQATEALRLAHTAQLERQMYDQEQLLADLHQLRTQLAENASAISENQVTEREKILLEELETMKQSCAEAAGRTPVTTVQDSSSQTQHEPEPQPEREECEQEDGERKVEDKEIPSGDVSSERKSLKRANKHLLKILLEVVKTTGAVEETIGRHVLSLLDKSGRRQSVPKVSVWSTKPEELQAASAAGVTVTGPGDVDSGAEGQEPGTQSEAVDEEVDVPLQLTEGDVCGTDISPEDEAQILNISNRLQAAVEKLLEAINETSNQLEHAKATQTELVRESIKRKQETTDLLRCQEELQERLNEEASAREHLVLELSKAEGLLDGYSDERVFLEKQLQEKSDLIRHLEQELQSTGNRLQELEQDRQQIEEEKELLSRQREALKADAAPAEQSLVEAAVVAAPKEELLEETEKLLKERIEVQRQAEKDSGDLHKQVKVLEAELEEQVNHYTELEQEKNADLVDLRQKNISLEKQLEKTRRFLDEQAVDREHERDVFQQEIQKLEQQLKMPQRHQPVNDHQSNEVEKLESSLKEKTDKCSELLLCKEQLQRDVLERNEEIEKLECRIRELEQALIISADSLQKVEERRTSIVLGVKGEMPLEAQLQVEREAIDRKEKEVTNLVEQLEQFREELENKNEEVQQLHMQLEIQRKESATRLQELEQENKVLQEGIEKTQQEHQETNSSKLPHFRADKVEEILLSKDQEISLLNEQIVNSQAQLEAATYSKLIEEKNEKLKEYKSQIKCLKSDQERLKKNSEEEVEKLNEVIEKLQDELSRIEQKVPVEVTSAEDRQHQFADLADREDLLQSLSGESDVTLANTKEQKLGANRMMSTTVAETENMSSSQRENDVSSPSSQVSVPLREDVRIAMQDMESQLQQLQQVIKEKDASLKQYYDQVMTLKEQTQVIQELNEIIGRLQLKLADKDNKICEVDCSKHQINSVSREKLIIPRIEICDTDVTPLNSKLESTKAELEQLERELENIRNSSENIAVNKVAAIKSEDKIDACYTVSTEKLTEALREKTAQHLAIEALLASVQEASESTIHRLESQLQDLQKTVQDKDSQLLQLASSTHLLENQEIERLNAMIRTLQQDLADFKQKGLVDPNVESMDRESQTLMESNKSLLQKVEGHEGEAIRAVAELEETKMELTVLKEELEKLREAQKHIGVSEDSDSGKSATAKEGILVTNLKETLLEETAQALVNQAMVTAMEETTLKTFRNMELQLQDLQNVIQQKDSVLLQYVNQKDLLIQQTEEVERLNEVIRTLKQEFSEVGRKVSINSEVETKARESVTSHEGVLIENQEFLVQKAELDGGEAMQAKAELEEARIELTHLKEELEKLRESQKHINVTEQNASSDRETTKEGLKAAHLEEALIEKTSELLASQAMITSLEDATQAAIHNMESQLQQLQKEIQVKDLELLQYVNQQNLLNQQVKEIERLNGVIETLCQKSREAGQWTSIEKSESSSHQLIAQWPETLAQHMNGNTADTANTLEAKTGVNCLKEEPGQMQRTFLAQDAGQSESSRYATLVTQSTVLGDRVDKVLGEKTENQVLVPSVQETMQSTIDSMESQLQELRKVIKEKELDILLNSEEIETLKDQLKVESDHHSQIMLDMEDTLREKVAAALVSEAQLKAFQVHAKQVREDDRSCILEKESTALQAIVSEHSMEEGAEPDVTVLTLRLLELEKQLSDLHEQLEEERDLVNIANQQVAEKEQQLYELQQVLDSTGGKQDMDWAQSHVENVDSAISQGNYDESYSTVIDLERKVQIIEAEGRVTKEELNHYREMTETLRQELTVKESSLAHLEEDLQELKKCFAHAEEKLAFYMQRELQQLQQQSTSGIDSTDSVRSTDWTSSDKTTSSSQTDKVSSVNNSNQTSHVHQKHIGVQNELGVTQLGNSSDQVAELMERYSDKIGQMQELHAAEILDMEARHISEADSLRRDQYAVVQALTEECDALKAVIEALKTSAGGAPDSALSTSFHFTDAASSECDWSQGTYDVQSFDQLPGLTAEGDIPTELIPSQIKDLLRAVHQEGMQVLSLTEAASPDKETSFPVNAQSWHRERKALLETIGSLKALIRKIQVHKESEPHTRSDIHDLTPDWRGELLRAIQEVFCREQDVLMSAFHTQLTALANCNAPALLNQMQHRLQEQGMEQINAMDCIQNADRRSLLLEIQDLRAQLTNLQSDAEVSPIFHANTEAGGAQHIQQDQPSHSQEIHLQLNSLSAKAAELQEQLASERLSSAEVKNELALTKMELESALKLQHKHFKELESVRSEAKKKREELDSISDALANEQKKSREFQWSLEKEKTKRERNEQRQKEELEDLQILLEDQKAKNLEISKRLEEEEQLVKELQEQIASRENLHEAKLSQERSKVSELQAFLDAEKTHSSELANALECKQGLDANVQSSDGNGQSEAHKLSEDLLRELQGQLDSKHSRIVELVSDVESHKLECVQLRQSLEEQRQSLQKELEAEQEAAKLAETQLEELMATVEGLQQQIQERDIEVRRHQTEGKQLKETIQRLQSTAHERVKESGSERRERPEISTPSKIPARNDVQLQAGDAPNVLCPDPLSVPDGGRDTDEASFSLDGVRRRLRQVSVKLRKLAAKASQRVLFEGADDDAFAWSQNSIQDVLSQLEHVAMLSLQGQNLVLPPGLPANTLTEKLLTQNAELTGYVSRLTGEKNDLQNALLRLEGEVSRHRAKGSSGDYSAQDNTVTMEAFAAEREAWNREKLNLHKSLKQTEAELSKVKVELRNEAIQRDLGRDTENVALKRVYGKYLRSESFRKALVYQKKYLLLLLGGFQECEEATLALIARMGGRPSYTDLEVVTKHSRAFTRFRSTARVAIAISRMKFLVRRWQRATSPGTGGVNRNGFGQNIGNEVRTDSPYHPAGSVDLYGEQRLSSCRSRSGFDSPQSTVNSQHRYISSELSPCSHLQHYDPDRALTDYIARLEALQKRLGSVPSGSSANNTTHCGIRR